MSKENHKLVSSIWASSVCAVFLVLAFGKGRKHVKRNRHYILLFVSLELIPENLKLCLLYRFITQSLGKQWCCIQIKMYRLYIKMTMFVIIFLAHLSRRLMDELIVYPCSGVRPSVVRTSSSSSTISNIFFSETVCPIKPKFYVEPPWVGGTKVCSRHLDHMTKMAATPIYGKNPSKIFFSRTGRPIFTKPGM